eukprot:6193310-Amphidinium_carterae.1
MHAQESRATQDHEEAHEHSAVAHIMGDGSWSHSMSGHRPRSMSLPTVCVSNFSWSASAGAVVIYCDSILTGSYIEIYRFTTGVLAFCEVRPCHALLLPITYPTICTVTWIVIEFVRVQFVPKQKSTT